MHPLLTSLLAQWRNEPLVLGDAPYGGGAANLRSISWGVTHEVGTRTQDWTNFVLAALEQCRSQARSGTVATFYAWHDSMANQLRFSVAARTPSELPFSSEVEFVEDLNFIVEAWLLEKRGDTLPWSDLEPISVAGDNTDVSVEAEPIRVWARALVAGAAG